MANAERLVNGAGLFRLSPPNGGWYNAKLRFCAAAVAVWSAVAPLISTQRPFVSNWWAPANQITSTVEMWPQVSFWDLRQPGKCNWCWNIIVLFYDNSGDRIYLSMEILLQLLFQADNKCFKCFTLSNCTTNFIFASYKKIRLITFAFL